MAAADRADWWSVRKLDLLDDGRFVSRVASLDVVVAGDRCVCFDADDGASWLVLSLGANNSLFIEFVFSSKAGAVGRWLPEVRRFALMGGFECVLFRAWGAGQCRLFRRFECVGDNLFKLG